MKKQLQAELIKAFKAAGFKVEGFKLEQELDKAVEVPTAFIEFAYYEPAERYENGEISAYAMYFPCIVKAPYKSNFDEAQNNTINMIEKVREIFDENCDDLELQTIKPERLDFNSVYGAVDKGSSNLIFAIDAAIRYSFL